MLKNKTKWFIKHTKRNRREIMYKTIVTERIFIAVKFNKHKFLPVLLLFASYPLHISINIRLFLHAQIHTQQIFFYV